MFLNRDATEERLPVGFCELPFSSRRHLNNRAGVTRGGEEWEAEGFCLGVCSRVQLRASTADPPTRHRSACGDGGSMLVVRQGRRLTWLGAVVCGSMGDTTVS